MSHLLSRRELFALGMTAPALRAWQEKARPGSMKITAVEFVRLEGERESAGGGWQHQVQPIHIYPEHRPKEYVESLTPGKGTAKASALYLRIGTDAGVEGFYGPIDREAALIVDQQLKGFVLGKDPLAVEALWDKMHRSNRHSRAGTYMMAISAIDMAVWDLRGRYYNAPVYKLLGGPTRNPVEAYGSMLGYSVQPELAAKRVAEFKQKGFRHQKWFIAYGPGDGYEGLKKNIELVRNLRFGGGPEVEIMFDAFSGWTLDYAIRWAKEVEQYRPRWIEEAFPADKIDAFAQLRRSTSVPVASGEHFYGRWEAWDYLKAGAISVVQADPEWCGGVSELVKICHIASLFDAQVIPHGHGVHAALHVVASQPPATCPLVEYLYSKMQSYYWFEKHAPAPERGHFSLTDRPGFGIEFDPSKVLKRSTVSWGQREE